MHEGEILLMENDVIGDDVNIASRIEAFSAPGGIAISNKVMTLSQEESLYNKIFRKTQIERRRAKRRYTVLILMVYRKQICLRSLQN